MPTLRTRAGLSLAGVILLMGAILFIGAGTFRWWEAWAYLVLSGSLSFGVTLDLLKHDPALLERRMKGGPFAEPRPVQRLIMFAASLGFIGILVLPALDFRYRWSHAPLPIVILGEVLFITGFLSVARVYRANTFAAATIQVSQDQRVISTGPYAVVRHPMYASALLYVLGTPLALGSYIGLLAVAFMLPFLIWRLLDEERMLARELAGYTEYRSRVRYRLVPFLW